MLAMALFFLFYIALNGKYDSVLKKIADIRVTGIRVSLLSLGMPSYVIIPGSSHESNPSHKT